MCASVFGVILVLALLVWVRWCLKSIKIMVNKSKVFQLLSLGENLLKTCLYGQPTLTKDVS